MLVERRGNLSTIHYATQGKIYGLIRVWEKLGKLEEKRCIVNKDNINFLIGRYAREGIGMRPY